MVILRTKLKRREYHGTIILRLSKVRFSHKIIKEKTKYKITRVSQRTFLLIV